MAKRRYTNITIGNLVYCSSTGHHEIDVWMTEGTRRRQRSYDFSGGFWLPETYIPRTMPAYVIEEVERLCRNWYEAGELRFYENDRDGNPRFTDLRYHDPKVFERRIGLKTS